MRTVVAVGVLAALSVAGCGRSVEPPDAASSDAAVVDVGAPALDRPPGSPTLQPRCGERAYDLARPETYDTREELAVAIFEAECARSLRRADCLGASLCDPESSLRPFPGELHAPFDVAQARACLEALDADGCGRWMLLPACAALRVDRAPDGAACDVDTTCASQICRAAEPLACGGTCVAPRACTSCGTSEWCDPRTGTCIARREIGECCLVCADGLSSPCVDGAVCFEATCVAPLAAGGACGGYDSLCEPGLRCGLDEHCAAPREVAIGAPCDEVLASCPEGSDCDRSGPAPTCVARAREGEACAGRRCESGLACSDAGVCAPIAGPGCPCGDNAACPYGLVCASGACQPIGAAAPACRADADCATLPCVAGRCARRGIGARCTPTEDCNDGHCHTGRCVPDLPLGADCAIDPVGCARTEACVGARCATVTGNRCW